MLEIADRPKAARYEEWAVSLHRFCTLDRILHERPQPEWLIRGADNADRRIKRDNEQGICGCHLCEARKDDRKWNSGR